MTTKTRLLITAVFLSAVTLCILVISDEVGLFTAVAQTETDDAPTGELTASATTVDVGQPVELTATNLRNVGTHVRFRLRGSLSFERDCSDLGRRSLVPPPPEPVTYKASIKVYACAPGGTSTAIVETTDGVFIDDITITVNRPVTLTATKTTIDIGERTTVKARNIPASAGSRVRFGFVGPIHYDRSCGSDRSARTATRSTQTTITATIDVFGCAPGGTGTLILRTSGGRELKRITINVNRAPVQMSASRNPVYIGQTTTVIASRLPADVGQHVTFRATGPLSFSTGCASSTSTRSDPGSTVRTTVTYTARIMVYGCAPHGDGTVTVLTSAGVPLGSIDIRVIPPRITGPREAINIGQSASIVATDLYNTGGTVTFALTGPLHFNQSCTDSTSRSINAPPSSVAGGKARVTIYGCAPGGTGVVTLRNSFGTTLNSITVDVARSSGNTPTGQLTASLTTIDIGQPTVLTISNLNTQGIEARFEVDGPIDADQYCGVSVRAGSESSAAPTTPITNNSQHTYFGCVPGGSATIELKAGDFTLGSVTINVNELPEYAALIPPPGSGLYCRLPFTNPRLVASSTTSVISPGGFSHSATAEIWAGEYRLAPVSDRCVEARFVNESAPGSSLSTWRGTKYETQRRLRLVPDIDLENLMEGEFDDVVDLFYEPDPISDGQIVSPEVSASCARCQGGTLQTVQHVTEGKFIKHSKIHLRGHHTFSVGDWSQSVSTSSSWEVTPYLEFNPPEAGLAQIRDEVVELIADYAEDVVDRFINWIWDNVRP